MCASVEKIVVSSLKTIDAKYTGWAKKRGHLDFLKLAQSKINRF